MNYEIVNLEEKKLVGVTDRTKNSDEIKKLLYEYKEAEYRLEEFIFNATFLLPINKDTISGYCGVENAETEEKIYWRVLLGTWVKISLLMKQIEPISFRKVESLI